MIFKSSLSLLPLIFGVLSGFSQNKTELIRGNISYVTSNNVYVKFENTESIDIGDTLQLSNENILKPCLKVVNKSSTSCVCTIVNDLDIKVGDQIYYRSIIPSRKENPIAVIPVISSGHETVTSHSENTDKSPNREDIKGRISASSYSNLSSIRDDRHRMMYRLSLNASHINNSKFSFDIYMNYRQNFIENESTYLGKTKFFNVYNLAIRYDLDSTMSMTLGRKINNKASSLGAIDGLQAEKYFGKFYTGIIVGSRPDMFDYSFNPDLFQYGGYIGVMTESQRFYSQTTLGLLEQNNNKHVDRRYAYFQHSSTIYRKLNLFSSSEVDFYNEVNGESNSDIRLTNLFVSAGYRISRKINLTVSYDTRKRILYYETYKTEIEQLLEDDESRQGLRFRLNVKPFKYFSLGGSVNRRFQTSGQNKSDNIYTFISMSKLPSISGRLVLSYNQTTSEYLHNQAMAIRYSRSLIKGKLNADFYFRMVNYEYSFSEVSIAQNYYGSNFSYNINRSLVISIFGELATRTAEDNYRVNFKIVKRINKKKK